MKQRTIYTYLAAGGVLGLAASFLELIEYQEILKNAHTTLTCDLNSVFNCSPVLTAWQSKVFGFPNTMMCIVFFTLMISLGLIGLTGSVLVRKLRLYMQGFALFFLCFALWFFWQSIYRIGAICILCAICLAGLLIINWGWLRTNVKDLPVSKKHRAFLEKGISSGADILFWFILGAIVAFAMLIRFR